MSNHASEWVLQFKKVNADVISQLRNLITCLPVTRREGGAQTVHKWEEATIGSLENVVEALRRALESDWEKNQDESAEASWEFDYVVFREDLPCAHVYVATRYYHTEQSGNIFYGRTVRRIDETRFAIWIDD
jgi:hypothetical protein